MGKKIVTSIKIDEDIWKKAKIEAIKREVTVSDFLDTVIQEELRRSK